MTLEAPFPSSPSRPPRFVIRADNVEAGTLYLSNAYSLYAARKLYDALCGGMPRVGHTSFYVQFGHVRIGSDQITQIMGHKYTSEEDEWQLPDNVATAIRQFVIGKNFTGHAAAGKDDAEGSAPPTAAALGVRQDRPAVKVDGDARQPIRSSSRPSSAAKTAPRPSAGASGSVDELGDRVTLETVKDGIFNRDEMQRIAVHNDVWKYDYLKLSNGLMRMTIVNRLRGIVKKGGSVKW